jgi:hypothetical protein
MRVKPSHEPIKWLSLTAMVLSPTTTILSQDVGTGPFLLIQDPCKMTIGDGKLGFGDNANNGVILLKRIYLLVDTFFSFTFQFIFYIQRINP